MAGGVGSSTLRASGAPHPVVHVGLLVANSALALDKEYGQLSSQHLGAASPENCGTQRIKSTFLVRSSDLMIYVYFDLKEIFCLCDTPTKERERERWICL